MDKRKKWVIEQMFIVIKIIKRENAKIARLSRNLCKKVSIFNVIKTSLKQTYNNSTKLPNKITWITLGTSVIYGSISPSSLLKDIWKKVNSRKVQPKGKHSESVVINSKQLLCLVPINIPVQVNMKTIQITSKNPPNISQFETDLV